MSFLSSHFRYSLLTRLKFQSGANDARSDDTSRLKVTVAEWLNTSSRMCSNGAPTYQTMLLSAKAKEERGISHDVTGRLLCPIDYDWDDPGYVASLYLPG